MVALVEVPFYIEAVGSAIRAAREVEDVARDVNEANSRIRRWARALLPSEGVVAIIGSAGVGKSSAFRFIGDNFSVARITPERVPTDEFDEIDSDEYSLKIVDTAGQESGRFIGLNRVGRRAKRVSRLLVIHVTAYGYNTAIPTRLRADIQALTKARDAEKALEKWLSDERKLELSQLKTAGDAVAGILADHKRIRHSLILTLVLKQDLWWNNKEEVERYYMDLKGPYQEVAQETAKRFGRPVDPMGVSTCLIETDFKLGGRCFRPSAEDYPSKVFRDNLVNAERAIRTAFRWAENGG